MVMMMRTGMMMTMMVMMAMMMTTMMVMVMMKHSQSAQAFNIWLSRARSLYMGDPDYHHNALIIILLYILIYFFGPRSDPSLQMLATDSLTDLLKLEYIDPC